MATAFVEVRAVFVLILVLARRAATVLLGSSVCFGVRGAATAWSGAAVLVGVVGSRDEFCCLRGDV